MKKTFTILYLIMGLFCSGLILADNKIKIQKGFEFHHPFSSKAESPILEDFEDESINSKTFSSNGQEFTISSGNSNLFDIYNSGGDLYGWNGSSADSKFIDNSSSVDNNIDLTIATSDNKAFILKSFYLFIAQGTGVITGVNGDITIVGSKNGVTQFTNTVNSGYNTSTNSQNGYTFINMSTFGGDNNSEIEIDKFTILSTGNIRYIALDAMSWAPGVVAANCAPNHGVTDFEGFYSTFTELNSGTGSATATVACFDITSETLNPSHTARVTGTSISGNELLIIQGVGTSPNANLKRAIIKSNDGSSFSFKSIKVQPFGTFSDLQITYEGYLNGVQVSNANLDRSNMTTGTIYNDSFLSIPAFNEVDEIRIEFNFVGSSFQNFRIDDIEIGPANTATSPTVLTNAATSILASEVTLNGNISDDGGANVTARGFVYSSSDNSPILGEGGVTNVTIGSGTGAFQETIAGLSPSTTYYFQAYATNSEGTSYGGVEIFTTLNQVSAPTITSTPILTAPYSQQYNYSIVGTVDNELETTLSATTLPNWLTFSSDGQGVSSRFGDIPAWVALSGVAGDGEGNVFAIRNNGTEIFKIEPDGTTTSWKSGLTSSTVYALHIANGFVYIPRYGNSSQSITRIPLDNPNAPEEIFLSRSGGALSLTDKDGFIYAAIYNSREIIKINETTKDFEILINNQTGLSSYSPFGMTFDKNGDLFIATYGVRSIIKYDGSSVTPVLTNLPNNVSSIRNDAAGNFYLSMSGGGVRKYNADFSSFETVSVNANDNVWSLSLTAAGSLVYSRQGTNEVYRLQTGAILTGIPAKSDIGEHPVVLRAANDNGYTEQEFTITVTDETAPLLTTFSPEKNADDVELTPELTLTFDEEIVLGNIGVLSIESGGSILQSFDLAIQEERELIEVSEDRLSILVKITNPLALNTTISIGITEGFFKDDFDNDFAGFLASSNTWNFRTLNKQNQTISFPEISDKIYGDDAFILGAEETDQGLTIVYTANDPSIVSISGNQATILKAGSTEITATQSGDDNFIEATPVIRTLAIDKAIVTITAEDQSKVYGESNPSLTFAYDGLVNGDTEVSTEPSISTTATASSTTGTYPITLSGGSDANYAITLVDGTLTVDQKAVTITADDKSKIYGESNPSVTFAYDGLVNGDEKVATEPSISTTATASSDAGTYPITLSGGSDANYAITLVDGTLTVGQKAVMITAEDQSKVYGESNPSLTFAYDGLVNGDEKISTEPSISTTATASSNTGTYPITLSGGSDANYAITVVDGTLTVGQKTLTITAEDQSKVYGETNPSLTFAYDGLVNGDEKISTEPSISTTASASSNTGTYPITLSGGSDANYAITVVDGTLTVGQKAVTITADDKSKIYGESNPSLTFAYDGLVNGDEKISTEPSISTTATASSNTGTYPITLSGGSDANYAITLVDGTLTVGQKAVTITAEDQSKVYGETNPSLTFTYDGLVNGDEKVSTEPSISTTATASSNTGTYPITLSGGSDANYAITLANGTLTVGQKSLTITADNKSKIYGEGNPSLTFAYDGLVNGDEKVATEPSISTTATASSDAGTYPITLSGGTDANYAITLVDGTLTVGQKAVTITAEDQSKVYGETNPSLSFTYDGLVNGDVKVATEPSISTTATASSNTGTYPITLSGGSDANYAITLANGTLTVGQKAVTITAEDQSKVYGEINPSLTFTYDGLVNGDSKVSTEPSISTTATASSDAGTYPITLSGGTDANYAITLANGTLTVGQKSLTITADNKSKIYGESNPSLTFAYDGLVNGDEKVATEPSISTTATASSDAGTYPITLSGGSDANYAITLANGTLTVGQKAVTITAEDQSKVYGEINPSLTFTYDGLVNGDEKVSTEPSISTTATASSNTGTYPIALSGGSDANYAITLANGTLTVGQKTLTIIADDKSKIYGESNPSLTFTYDGLVNGDEKVSTEPSISTTATASSNTGTYPIALSGGSDANYAITLANGTLTVGQKSLTITADDKSKIYGESNSSLTFTYDGLVNGDEKVATEPSISTTATASSNTGTYPIALSGGSDANYAITLVDGTLTVGQKAVTITAEDQSKVYGESNPSLTFAYDGLVNGDEKISTEPSISTTATASSNTGTYPIALSGGSDANYAITLANGTLTVGQKVVTITAEDQSKVYGESNPSLTFAYDGLVNGDEKISTEPSISTTATASSNTGTYPIALSGGSDANYAITLVDGTLTVGQKAVTITAEDQSKVYGETNPSLSFAYDGLVNGDEKISTEPSISTTATASSNTGTYPITLSGGTDSNYAITLVNGTLTVGQKAVTITADDKSKIYGEGNPSLTFAYDGLVNGDEKVVTEPSISTKATASSNTGTYPITLSGGTDANYAITLVNGTLTVGQKAVTITADDKSKIYGESNPSLTFAYDGLVNGDEKVATEPSISTTATASSNTGTYPITLSGGSDANYAITVVDGTLTVEQKTLTITAEDQSKVYGETNPSLTFAYDGLVNGDEKISTEPSISTTATASSNTGTYPITLSGGSDANYAITLANGTLTVGQKAVTITAEDQSKVYGESNASLTFTYDGLVNGDEKVATEPSISTTATASSNTGTYPITLSGGTDANYAITLVDGELEIAKANLEVRVEEGQSKVFGTADPEFAFTATGFVARDDQQVFSGKLSRTAGEGVGNYPINIGDLTAGANYDIEFRGSEFEILAAEIEMVMQPSPIATIWGVDPALPNTIIVMATDGQFLELPITWDLQTLYIFGNGDYPLTAVINLPSGILNSQGLVAEIVVTVLPKPAPEDILLDNNSFEAEVGQAIIAVGNLTVVDPLDNQHEITLADLAFDNVYFQIDNGTLFWNSEERAEGRREFKILVRVKDRDGNIIEKEFSIIRNRTSVSNIEIFNSFTPDGDNVNDTWGVEELRFYNNVRIQIFERSGNRVFYTENPDERWDGKYSNKEMPVGTYYWIVEVGETGEVRKGLLNLIKQ